MGTSAIGNDAGQIELVYPEDETWLGVVSPDAELTLKRSAALKEYVALTLKKSSFIRSERAAIKMLDDYCCDIPRNNVLVKIDVEGWEREVIRGSSKLLRNCKPKPIFETYDTKSRAETFRLLAENGYSIHQLPWQPSVGSRMLELDEFSTDTATNFIAISS